MQWVGRTWRRWSKGIKLMAPLLFWGLTAAPSFVESKEGAFELAGYADVQTGSKALAGQLFDRQGYRPVIDTAVEDIYLALSANQLDKALKLTDRLLAEFPNFHLGYMIRGDILSMKAGRMVRSIGDIPNVPKSKQDDLADLKAEAVARFRAVRDRPKRDLLPAELVELDSDQRYVILVDTSRSRLFLYENAFPYPRLVTDFYISQGRMGAVKSKEGDKRTPIGVYTITELLPKEKLSDFYGPIALPINYPNTWDKRLGKTGNGIWLHGMPKSYVSRPPKASDGCVVLANQDLLALKQFVRVGNTQVLIAERLDFVPQDVWQTQRKASIRVLKAWKDDLEKGLSKGLAHYSSEVRIDGKDLGAWQRAKHLDQKGFGTIKINDITMMRYPSEKNDMMWVSFRQEDRVSGEVRKQQYWMKVGTRWQIVQEDTEKL
ncbi:L,D-transpeptidase family protein [Limnobacter humi]|uniref:L,D-transpeptidase family protein n=1 Tax=Limnobacter humi TaxID=1778671 RepID=A0ABT1WJV3_9BURK|nr:L,D-transpeptidase family protein [Limnobacter humi]MCQ8897188.1 L,D-transpeptidase family protein [Limnobacter humi]